ncbi:hypothetical protein AB0J48_34160 [Nocardia salmonicida]|uniref:NucA/NucB deoxyribonuclease domain-containing protein n=1 Tax=Nocardia salmonicida TaxID=53431 RepID=UPI003443F6DE
MAAQPPSTSPSSPSTPTPSTVERKPADRDWTPTENPNATVIPGKMRSDREDVPGGFSKADADKAETMEAKTEQGGATFAAPGCQVYWPAPYEVCGAIKDKYNELGGPSSFLLWPTTNELTQPDGIGKRTVFQNGPIFWSPWGGAHPVVNHFYAAWQRNGWEAGILGYPTSDEVVNADGVGRRQEFQHGAIYWRLNEAYAIGGAIRDRWNQLGAEGGPLGYPTTDEVVAAKYDGRYNNFENGTIIWSGQTGTDVLFGTFRDKWAAVGREGGFLGYPTTDEQMTPNGLGRYALFEGGSIYQKNGGSGPFIVAGAIAQQWGDFGWEAGRFGFPISDEYDMDGGRAQDFEHGTLVWNVGDPRSDFDPPTGTCPANICENPTPGVLDDSPTTQRAPADSKAPPPCSEVRKMAPDPGKLILCVKDDSADGSGQRAPLAGPEYPSDSAIQKVCYDEFPAVHTERLYSCRVVVVNYEIFAPGQTEPAGGTQLTVEMESRTKWDTKVFTFRQRAIVVDVWGAMSYAKLKMVPLCVVPGQACDIQGTQMPWWEMEDGKKFFVENNIDPGSIPQDQLVGVNELAVDFNFRPGPAYSWEEIVHVQEVGLAVIRCDNKLSANKPGCVFPEIRPVLTYFEPGRNGELAGHIAAAQNSGVPGGLGSQPLHKGTKELETENRDITCKDNPRVPSPRPQGRDCDEYPFASSREGGTFGGAERTFGAGCLLPDVATGVTGPGYSICLINPSHNRSGGSDARWFYHWNRVILDDPFYVQALNGYLPAP